MSHKTCRTFAGHGNLSYRSRILSFSSYNHEKVSAHALAAAGFHVEDNTIKCSSCGLKLSANFRENFDPKAFHQVHSRNTCELANEIRTPADDCLTGEPRYYFVYRSHYLNIRSPRIATAIQTVYWLLSYKS